MATVKEKSRKLRLIKRGNQNRPIPLWVVAKTKRKVRWNPLRFNWRRSKLKV
ncbi:MAG TPA: 50S ribosomal protein L39e [archaeon]|nr:50S ribosomal protein L39e [archaeon]